MQLLDSAVAGALALEREADQKDAAWALLRYMLDGEVPEGLRRNAAAIMAAVLPALELSRARADAPRNRSRTEAKRRTDVEQNESETEANPVTNAEQNGSKTGNKRGTNEEQTGEQTANKTGTNRGTNAKQTAEQNRNKHGTKPGTKGEQNGEQTRNEEEGEEEIEKEKEPPEGGSKKKESGRFSPPSPEEVAAYAAEASLAIDPERFCDFYASKGWKVGSEQMRDWKAAARNWARRDFPQVRRAVSEYDGVF